MTKPQLPPSKDLQLASRVEQVRDDLSHHRKEIVLKRDRAEERKKKKKPAWTLASADPGGVGLGYITVLTESGILFTYIQQYICGQSR